MVVPVHAPHVAGSSEACAEAVFDHSRQMLAEAVAVAEEAAPEDDVDTTIVRNERQVFPNSPTTRSPSVRMNSDTPRRSRDEGPVPEATFLSAFTCT
jgi:hypothetical protein